MKTLPQIKKLVENAVRNISPEELENLMCVVRSVRNEAVAETGNFCNEGLLKDDVVRDVWCLLHGRVTDAVCEGDPLSKKERELYDAMSAWLICRASVAAVFVSGLEGFSPH
jgi:hypothetical protein